MTQMPKSLPPEVREAQEPLAEISARLEKVSAEERVRWALERFRPEIMLSTSFGATIGGFPAYGDATMAGDSGRGRGYGLSLPGNVSLCR